MEHSNVQNKITVERPQNNISSHTQVQLEESLMMGWLAKVQLESPWACKGHAAAVGSHGLEGLWAAGHPSQRNCDVGKPRGGEKASVTSSGCRISQGNRQGQGTEMWLPALGSRKRRAEEMETLAQRVSLLQTWDWNGFLSCPSCFPPSPYLVISTLPKQLGSIHRPDLF